jgi:carbon monoxide dehydrogenase subunit G
MSLKVDVPVQHRMFWLAFADLERLMLHAPGFTLIDAGPSSDATDVVTGRLRLRIGSTSVTYEGTIRVLTSDPTATVLVLGLDGQQVRGTGTVTGTVHIELHRAGAGTHVTVVPKVTLTGRVTALGAERVTTAATRFVTAWLEGLAEQFHRPGPAPDVEAPGHSGLHTTPQPVAAPAAESVPEPPAEPEREPAEAPRHVVPPAASTANGANGTDAVVSESDLWPLGGPPQPRWLLIIGVAAGVSAGTAVLVLLAIRRRFRSLVH